MLSPIDRLSSCAILVLGWNWLRRQKDSKRDLTVRTTGKRPKTSQAAIVKAV